MIEPKVGQVWECKKTKEKEIIERIYRTASNNQFVQTNIGTRAVEDFNEYLTFNKKETIKYLKEKKEKITKEIEELSKPEVIDNKFEVIIAAEETFGSDEIISLLESALESEWVNNYMIRSYSINKIEDK